MAASDGGHVWPPRASDLRIQELTGAGPEASKPDDVFKALRALGRTGSLDDMWHQQLADQSITDTSEPFTETVGVVAKVDDDFADVSLLLQFYGEDAATTIVEGSANAHDVTFAGNAALETSESNWGSSSLYLEEPTDTLTIPHHASLDFLGDTLFTVEIVAKGADFDLTAGVELDKGKNNNYAFDVNNSGAQGSTKWYGQAATRNYNLLVGEVTDGGWNHFAWQWNGTQVMAYSNGTRIDLDNDPGLGWPDGSAYPLIIRPVTVLTGNPIYIDSIRITKNVNRYTLTGFTPPTEAFGTVGP